MSTPEREHRLEGLEPDNLLAFLALLGLLRALEHARPAWRPRVRWSLDEPPLRPMLVLREPLEQADIAQAAAEGLDDLAKAHAFGRRDLNHSVSDARAALSAGRNAGGYAAELASALMSDAAVKTAQGKPLDVVEATPMCLLFGQGHQHFLERLGEVPREPAPPSRGKGKKAVHLTPAECLAEALYQPWRRLDPTFSFRWDPEEAMRYALMSGDPSEAKNKDGTQHGANRLAAIGLSALPVAPEQRGVQVRLGLPGGAWRRGFSFAWPIWRDPVGLQAIRGLLAHPDLREPAALDRLGVDHIRQVRRISVGKFMNFTAARSVDYAGIGTS
ncbi:hypothetical protein [Caulobacter sp. S45]|uniref:type I-G CRISPR-associated protein, Cas3-extension family n=1 Tax=Caulobacter sp. S45 TaxID=1641861 RepID=UPI0015771B34|nr:hypothetical protein [Caulobacter sp. S45]